MLEEKEAHTWVPDMTVGAVVVSGDLVDEVLKGLLVARLLALAESGGHDRPTSRVTMAAARADDGFGGSVRASKAEEKPRQGVS